MQRKMKLSVVLLLTISALLFSLPTYAKTLKSYDDLYKMLPGAGVVDNKSVIDRTLNSLTKLQLMKDQRVVEITGPREIFYLNERYVTISFNAEVKKQGSSARQKPAPAVYALLFEKNAQNEMSFFDNIYLTWLGKKDVEEYKRISPAKLSEYFRKKGAEYVFYDEKTKKPKAAAVVLNGSDIKTGVVKEKYIDSAIARDAEIQAILEGYVKKEVEKVEAPPVDSMRIQQLEARIMKLEALLENVTRNGNDIVFDNVNVYIQNGTGSVSKSNGTGNLIVGYGSGGSGSHNVVVGAKNKYSSYGGIVTGANNSVTGKYAVVIAGSGNKASGDYSVIAGGSNNNASGDFSSILGGSKNNAKGKYSSINGQHGRTKVGKGENPHFTN